MFSVLVTGYSRVEEIYVMLPTEHQFLLHIVIEITTISQILFCFVLWYWLGTPVGNTVLPEALIYIFRNLGDVEGRSCAELEMGGRGWSLSEKYKKTVVEAVCRLDTASKHKRADGWKVLLESCKAVPLRGAPHLLGLLTPLNQSFLFGMMW